MKKKLFLFFICFIFPLLSAVVSDEAVIAFVQHGNAHSIEKLLHNGVITKDQAFGKGGRTILHWAAYFGKWQFIDMCARLHFDFSLQDGNGETAWNISCEQEGKDYSIFCVELQRIEAKKEHEKNVRVALMKWSDIGGGEYYPEGGGDGSGNSSSW